MELKLEIGGYYCAPDVFVVNGVKANYGDFGEKYDRDSENAVDYCCANMQFTRVPPTPEVLEKYKITDGEYGEIAEKLEEGLSWGMCGMCA